MAEVKSAVLSQAEVDALLENNEQPDETEKIEAVQPEPRFFPKGNPKPDERRVPTMAKGGIIKQPQVEVEPEIIKNPTPKPK